MLHKRNTELPFIVYTPLEVSTPTFQLIFIQHWKSFYILKSAQVNICRWHMRWSCIRCWFCFENHVHGTAVIANCVRYPGVCWCWWCWWFCQLLNHPPQAPHPPHHIGHPTILAKRTGVCISATELRITIVVWLLARLTGCVIGWDVVASQTVTI